MSFSLNKCGIMGLREEEIELDLGLSIGGSFGKAEKLKPIKNESKSNNNSVSNLGDSLGFDPQSKREVQALRRQEARKKREQKQQKRGTCHADGHANAMEQREYCKKTKVEEFPGNGIENSNLSAQQNNPLASPIIPVRVPCSYPQLQFVPLVPCWGSVAGNEKGVVHPVAVAVNGGFRPAQDSGVNGSNGSPMYSSSVGSDLQSSSNQGGCYSETGTHTPQINCSVASNLKGQSEQSDTSHQTDSAQSIDKSRKFIENTPSLNATGSTSLNKKKQLEPQFVSDHDSKPVLTNETTTTTTLSKDTKGDICKPPKPRTPTNDDVHSLRNMPCVTTTGNGPNGKTINGFLYRYTKSDEVSIICVCHGNSFTPAEFVQHAGGTDVSHPLKHITMIPSAF